jgi:glycosyltransferase involved in cell wall biosynthesis
MHWEETNAFNPIPNTIGVPIGVPIGLQLPALGTILCGPFMRFSIITPSYRNSQWLRLCIASVADQQGVEVEHIVQDACSDDGTQEWLPNDPRVRAFIEKDQGMYDAINRGFRRATGELLAYLNCDEQYLPGTLKVVHDFFADQPEVDVLLSDTIVTDGQGNYVCHRCSLVPRKHQMWVRFPVLTCALFLRRRVVRELGVVFDTQWRDFGDWFWVQDMVNRGLRLAVLRRMTSVFADTGENMNLKPNAARERRIKWEMTPRWVKLASPLIAVLYRLRLATRSAMLQKPFDYSLYTLASPGHRVTRHASRPTSFWKRRPANT